MMPQFNEKGTEAYIKFGACTPESSHYIRLLFVLQEISPKDKTVQEALCNQFKQLSNAAGTGDGLIGPNLQVTARTLHQLWPSNYPKAQIGSSNNRVLNALGYLS